MTQGFFTIAFGRYYRKLARNLLVSYKLSSGITLPFYVITDREDKFVSAFDQVIVVKPSFKGRMNKLKLDEYLLFDENIFFDADCLIYGDLKEFFSSFSSSGYHISSLECNYDISWCKGCFTKKTARENGIDITMINTGMIYLRKDETTKQIMDDAKAFSCDGNDYDVPLFGDGPFFALAMTLHNQNCLPGSDKVSLMWLPEVKIKEIDIIKRKLRYIMDDVIYSSPVAHFSTINTRGSLYMWESLRAVSQFRHSLFSCLINLRITFWYLSVLASLWRKSGNLCRYFRNAVQYQKKGILLRKLKKHIDTHNSRKLLT